MTKAASPDPDDLAKSSTPAAGAKRLKAPNFRGSDFVMRYEQGRWAEDRILASINASSGYRALAYGRSGVGPKDKAKIPEYWAKYIQAESIGKRPDLLVLRREDYDRLRHLLPEDSTLATDEELQPFLEFAVCGIEAENSLWVVEKMPDYGKTKLTKISFIAPTVIVKREDEAPLMAWQDHFGIPICVVQVFYDRAYIVPLQQIVDSVKAVQAAAEEVRSLGLASMDAKARKKAADDAQKQLGVFITEQVFPDARKTTPTVKTIYRTHYSKTVNFGVVPVGQEPDFKADFIVEDNGKVMPYVTFTGGVLDLLPEAEQLIDQLAAKRLQTRMVDEKIQ